MTADEAALPRLTAERWLLSALDTPSRARARDEWGAQGITLLPLGEAFSAVRLPLPLVLAVTGGTGPGGAVDAALAAVLRGAVICDVEGRRYYALVAPGTAAAEVGHALKDGVAHLGSGTYLGVPRCDRTSYSATTRASYWSVPPSASRLCDAAIVARMTTTAVSAMGTP
ncbi:hypothetical protein [Streptomyces sp. SID8352]|uniref:hypothetical protein n=1 Tax=Streptomyces sp. SID8352 TaxID=2690338 RepID=UPI00136E4E5B|nr:hypothetical protein [Streptomyces sp. SID8352]MYU22860.1 hypothetical protein [Streptomyces sp. SID8352]